MGDADPDHRDNGPRVHLLCGLNGAGKTTLARRLAADVPAVRFTLDEWMLRLHGLRYDHPRYPALAERCQAVIWDVAQEVLHTGVDVVLDWNSWSRSRRRTWIRAAEDSGLVPVLHWVKVPLDVAVTRAENRASALAHVLDAQAVRHLASLFEEPSSDEGVEVIVHDG